MALSERGDALAEQAIVRYEMRLAKALAHGSTFWIRTWWCSAAA